MSTAFDIRARAHQMVHAVSEPSFQGEYLQALRLIERLHRLLLDVIRDEFDRKGGSDLNSVQALLLYNIGESELTAGDLKTRGYYLGSNVSYNLKKLVDMGYKGWVGHEFIPTRDAFAGLKQAVTVCDV
jgi:hypothetical protein